VKQEERGDEREEEGGEEGGGAQGDVAVNLEDEGVWGGGEGGTGEIDQPMEHGLKADTGSVFVCSCLTSTVVIVQFMSL